MNCRGPVWPIGLKKIIESADSTLLKGFYDHWYRPDNMALVIVGDMDIKLAQTMIEHTFSSLAPRSDLSMAVPKVKWTPHKGTRFFYHGEPEAGTTQITMERVVHKPFEPETIDSLKQETTQYIGNLIYQNRLSKMVRDQSGDFSSASVFSGNYLKHLKIAAVQASCDPEHWESTLTQLESSLRQALEFGFSPQEFARAKADVLSSLDAKAAKASTRKSHEISQSLLSTLNQKGLFLSPGQERDLLFSHIQSLTLDEVNLGFRSSWPDDHCLVLVTGNADPGDRPELKIANVFNQSRSQAVHPYEQAEPKSFPYLKLPVNKAHLIQSRENVKGLGIKQIDLGNNVRINLKPTQFKKGEFSFKAVFGKGWANFPQQMQGGSSD
ncbi:MAG: insulinase family protein [Desulfobacter sp.]|nr:MAG: insulinase family protein [Desulfobacter sp.]